MTNTTFPLTLRFPADYAGPVVHRQYRRVYTGQIEAWFYDREQLKWCVALGQRMKGNGKGEGDE